MAFILAVGTALLAPSVAAAQDDRTVEPGDSIVDTPPVLTVTPASRGYSGTAPSVYVTVEACVVNPVNAGLFEAVLRAPGGTATGVTSRFTAVEVAAIPSTRENCINKYAARFTGTVGPLAEGTSRLEVRLCDSQSLASCGTGAVEYAYTANSPPTVEMNPPAGVREDSLLDLTVVWKDDAGLNPATAVVRLNGTPVTGLAYTGSPTFAGSQGTLRLRYGANTVTAEIQDATGLPSAPFSRTYTYDTTAAHPVVTLTPAPADIGEARLWVTAGWECRDQCMGLDPATRSVTLNGRNVTDSLTHTLAGSAAPYRSGTSAGSLPLALGENVVVARVCRAGTDTPYCTSRETRYFRYAAERATPAVALATIADQVRRTGEGEASLTYSTPAYTSMDVARSVTLVYTAGQAFPHGAVEYDANDYSRDPPAAMSIALFTAAGARVQLLNGGYENVYAAGRGGNRLTALFAAHALATGAYTYTAVIRSHWADGTVKEVSQQVRVLILNERGSAFGAGWSMAGFLRLHPLAGGREVLLADGAGGVQYFRTDCDVATQAECKFVSPPGQFATLRHHRPAAGTVGEPFYALTGLDRGVVRFAADGFVESAADAWGNTVYVGVDRARGAPAYVQDPAGRRITFTYGAAGKLESISDSLRVSRFTMGATGALELIVDPDGATALDPRYNNEFQALGYTDRAGAAWDFVYDGRRMLASVTGPAVPVAGGTTARPETHFRSRLAIQHPQAAPTLAAPAVRVRPDEVWVKQWTPATARDSVTYVPDRFGLPARVRDPLGRVSRVLRDQHGRDTLAVAATGESVRTQYEGAKLVSVGRGTDTLRFFYQDPDAPYSPSQIASPATPLRRYWYGPRAQLDSALVVNETTRFRYDQRGRVLRVTMPAGDSVVYAYQPAGARNLESVRVTDEVTRYSFDAHGRVATVTDPLSRVTRVEYDALNRPVQTTNALDETTRSFFGAAWADSVRDAAGQAWGFRANRIGWDTASVDPLGRRVGTVYNAGRQVRRRVDRLGRLTEVFYDSLGQVREVRPQGMTPITYTWSPERRAVVIDNGVSQDTLTTDALGRVEAESTVRGGRRYRIASTYTDLRRWRVEPSGPGIPNAATTTYGWGDQTVMEEMRDPGALWSVTVPALSAGGAPHSTFVERLGHPLVQRVVLPTGDTLGFGYSARDELSGRAFSDPALAGTEARWYGRDSRGRLVMAGYGAASGAAGPDSVWVYRYDELGRLGAWGRARGAGACTQTPLLGWACPAAADTAWVRYGYDAAGNRAGPGAVVEHGNRLARFGAHSFEYNDDGSLRRKYLTANPAQFDQRFWWNALGQLDSVRTNGTVTRFAYDGRGRRIRKATGAQVTEYVYDGANVALEIDGATGALRASYAYYAGADRPHSVLRNGRRAYYVSDPQGSITALVDDAGAVVNRYRYDPWGQALSVSEGVENPFRYTGREYDAETGLYYFRARYYDPQTGRFVSEDPLGLADGLNPTAYAHNDPVNLVDPTGTKACKPGQAVVSYTGDQWWHLSDEERRQVIRDAEAQGRCVVVTTGTITLPALEVEARRNAFRHQLWTMLSEVRREQGSNAGLWECLRSTVDWPGCVNASLGWESDYERYSRDFGPQVAQELYTQCVQRGKEYYQGQRAAIGSAALVAAGEFIRQAKVSPRELFWKTAPGNIIVSTGGGSAAMSTVTTPGLMFTSAGSVPLTTSMPLVVASGGGGYLFASFTAPSTMCRDDFNWY